MRKQLIHSWKLLKRNLIYKTHNYKSENSNNDENDIIVYKRSKIKLL